MEKRWVVEIMEAVSNGSVDMDSVLLEYPYINLYAISYDLETDFTTMSHNDVDMGEMIGRQDTQSRQIALSRSLNVAIDALKSWRRKGPAPWVLGGGEKSGSGSDAK